jgi:hypothetical protein
MCPLIQKQQIKSEIILGESSAGLNEASTIYGLKIDKTNTLKPNYIQ